MPCIPYVLCATDSRQTEYAILSNEELETYTVAEFHLEVMVKVVREKSVTSVAAAIDQSCEIFVSCLTLAWAFLSGR